MQKKHLIIFLCFCFCLISVSATTLPNVSELPALSANDVWGYLGIIRPFNLTWLVINQEHYNNGTHKNISADSVVSKDWNNVTINYTQIWNYNTFFSQYNDTTYINGLLQNYYNNTQVYNKTEIDNMQQPILWINDSHVTTSNNSVKITNTSSNAFLVETTAGTDKFRVDTANSLVYSVKIRPTGNNSQDLGEAAAIWRTLFAFNLSDGTTSRPMGEILAWNLSLYNDTALIDNGTIIRASNTSWITVNQKDETGGWTNNSVNTSTSLNVVSANNITAFGYLMGQPLLGMMGSGIIQSTQTNYLSEVNLTCSGLVCSYNNFTVRLVSGTSDQFATYCKMGNGSKTVTDNQQSVLYVDSNCAVQTTEISNFFNTVIKQGGVWDFGNVVAYSGNTELVNGIGLEQRRMMKQRILNFNKNHLTVTSGFTKTTGTFPAVNFSSGSYIYLMDIVSAGAKNTSFANSVEVIHHNGTGWITYDTNNFNTTHCDNSSAAVACSSPTKYRRTFFFMVGYVDATDTSGLHQLLSLDNKAYTSLADCLDTTVNPITYTLPSFYTYSAVPLWAYCFKPTDSGWNNGWIDLRTTKTSVASTGGVDTSQFLSVDGSRALTANWNAGGYNITNAGINCSKIFGGSDADFCADATGAGGTADGTGGWTNTSTTTSTTGLNVQIKKSTGEQVAVFNTTDAVNILTLGNDSYAGQSSFAGRFYKGIFTIIHNYNMTSTIPELDLPKKAAIQILAANTTKVGDVYQREMFIGLDGNGANDATDAPSGYIQTRKTAVNSGELALQPWGGTVTLYRYSTGTLALNGFPIGGLGFYGIDSGYTNYLGLGDTGKGYCGSFGIRTSDAGKYELTLGPACVDQQVMTCDSASKCAFGTGTPTNRLSAETTTTPQFRVGYNAQNYTTFSTGSDGTLTLDSTGTTPSFYFNDNVGINMAPGATQKLAVRYDSVNGAAGYGARIRQIATGTGFAGGSVVGTYNELDMSGNATYSSYQSALYNTVNMNNNYPGATHYVRGADQRITVAYGAAEATGQYNYILHNAENVASTTLQGSDSFIQIAKGNVGTSTGIRVSASYVHAGVNLTNGNGIYIDTVENSTSGRITNHYSIRGRSTLEAVNPYFILADDGQSVFNENGENRSDFRVESDTQPYMFFVDSETNTVHIGDSAGTAPLTVGINNSGISIWSEGNISTTGVIVRSPDWNEDVKGYSLDKYQKISRLANGEINHSTYGVGVVKMKNKRIIGYTDKIVQDREDKTEFYNLTYEEPEDYYENITREVIEKVVNDTAVKMLEQSGTTGKETSILPYYEVRKTVTDTVLKTRQVIKTRIEANKTFIYVNKTIQEPIYEQYEVEGVLLDDIIAKHDDTLNYYTENLYLDKNASLIRVKSDKKMEVGNYIEAQGYLTAGADYSEVMRKQNAAESMANGDVICIGYNNSITRTTTTGTCIKFAVVSGSDAGVIGGKNTNLVYTYNGSKLIVRDDFTNSEVALVSFVGQKKVKVYGKCDAGNWLIPSGRNDGTAQCVDFKLSGNANEIVTRVSSKIGVAAENQAGATTTGYINAVVSGGW